MGGERGGSSDQRHGTVCAAERAQVFLAAEGGLSLASGVQRYQICNYQLAPRWRCSMERSLTHSRTNPNSATLKKGPEQETLLPPQVSLSG